MSEETKKPTVENQEKNPERRKVLKSTLAGGAVITTSVLPEKWSKPAVDAVIIPSHARMTAGGGDPGSGTTTATPTTTNTSTTTTTTSTTPAPTTTNFSNQTGAFRFSGLEEIV